MTNDAPERVTPDITFVTERFGDIGVHQAILELLNENKHLRTQLGQMHAASFRADQPPPTNQQSRGQRRQPA